MVPVHFAAVTIAAHGIAASIVLQMQHPHSPAMYAATSGTQFSRNVNQITLAISDYYSYLFAQSRIWNGIRQSHR